MSVNEKSYIILPQTTNGKTYFFASRTYRVKLDKDSVGKTKGTGKSKVVSEKIYLGTAQAIVDKFLNLPKPQKVKSKEFGLCGAMMSIIKKLGIDSIIDKHLPYTLRGIKASEFIIVSAINKASQSASKEKTGKWLETSSLARILKLEPSEFNSNNYWDMFDKIFSEAEVKLNKLILNKQPNSKLTVEELEKVIDDKIITKIELELYKAYTEIYKKKVKEIQIDGTNDVTHYQNQTRNSLAQKGRQKQGRNNKRIIGYLLACDDDGIPILHKTFCGNTHDSKIFLPVVEKLISNISELTQEKNKASLTFDKGNNSKKNIKAISKLNYVGSLPPSSLGALMEIPLKKYKLKYKEFSVLESMQTVFDAPHKIYITYNENLAKKQKYSFDLQKEKIIEKLKDCFNNHYQEENIEDRLDTILNEKIMHSSAKRYISYSLKTKKLDINEISDEIKKKSQCFGKNVIFTNKLNDNHYDIITEYKNKFEVENDFKTIKDHRLISKSPYYHWTDSKICVDSFVSTLSLFIIKIIHNIAKNANIDMGIPTLIRELKDIRESIINYDKRNACRLIEEMTDNQKILFDLFHLVDFVSY